MFLRHGRQDKQHPNHRNKISFRGEADLRTRLVPRARIEKQLRRSEIFIATVNIQGTSSARSGIEGVS